MGGERAQEMNCISVVSCQQTTIYFATHACKMSSAVAQRSLSANRTRKPRAGSEVFRPALAAISSIRPTDKSAGKQNAFLKSPVARLGDHEIAKHLQLGLVLHRIGIAEIGVEGRHLGLRQQLHQAGILVRPRSPAAWRCRRRACTARLIDMMSLICSVGDALAAVEVADRLQPVQFAPDATAPARRR